MNENVNELTYRLKKIVLNNPSFVRLNQLEEEINNNETLKFQSFLMQKAHDELENYLDNGNDQETIKALRANYSKAKQTLYENEIVREYLKAYGEVRLILDYINEELFSSIIGASHKCG